MSHGALAKALELKLDVEVLEDFEFVTLEDVELDARLVEDVCPTVELPPEVDENTELASDVPLELLPDDPAPPLPPAPPVSDAPEPQAVIARYTPINAAPRVL